MSRPGDGAVTHLALVGTTASGKSDLALTLAEALGDVEIVSVDSMQCYRGLDIGTAKPSVQERARVPHHLLDVAGPQESWSVARFQAEARAAVAAIEARDRRALLVGGTGLYFQAVVDDLRFPGEDPERRAYWSGRTADPAGLAAAYEELLRRDPVAAARIEAGNARRVARALEVIDLTGSPFSSFGPGLDVHGRPSFPVRIAGVWLPRAVVRARIACRVGVMRARGLLAEVRRLVDPAGPGLSRTARQAIGYKELLPLVGPGVTGAEWEPDLGRVDEAFTAVERRTRALARRQRMWFRRDPRVVWFGTAENPAALAPALLRAWRG